MAPGDFPELFGDGGRRLSVSNWIRGKVSKKKRRFTAAGFDLDLSYVTPRIIAMGFPAEKLEGLYRNRMPDVVNFFRTYHAAGHTRIFNLCSERSYPEERFSAPPVGASVARYPFDDHNPCELEQVIRFCEDAAAFLKADNHKVVAVHCKAGKGRTGMMIACLMMYLRMPHCATAQQAIEYYAKYRTKNGKGITISSQLRYVRYFEHWLKLYGKHLQPLPWLDDDEEEDEDAASPTATAAAASQTTEEFSPDFVPPADFFQKQREQQQQQAETVPALSAIPAAVPPTLQRIPLILRSISVQGSATAWKQGGRGWSRRDSFIASSEGVGPLMSASSVSAAVSAGDNAAQDGRRSRRGSIVGSLLSAIGAAGSSNHREALLVAEVYKPRSRARDHKNLEQVVMGRDSSAAEDAEDPHSVDEDGLFHADDNDDEEDEGENSGFVIPDVPVAVSLASVKHFAEDRLSTLQFVNGGICLRDDFYLVVREVPSLDQYPYRHMMSGGGGCALDVAELSKKDDKSKVKLQKPGKHGVVFKLWLHTGMLDLAPVEVNSSSPQVHLQQQNPNVDPNSFEVVFRKAELDGVSKRKEVEENFGCVVRFARPSHRSLSLQSVTLSGAPVLL